MAAMKRYQHLLPTFLLIYAVIACSLQGQSVIVVTATPSQAPVTPTKTPIPVTPTQTPLPTATPSPTVPPNIEGDRASLALHNGDYASALTIYQGILSRPLLSVDPRLRAD